MVEKCNVGFLLETELIMLFDINKKSEFASKPSEQSTYVDQTES